MVQFGEIVSVKAGVATVKLSGYEADAAIDVVLLQPGGGSSVKAWIPPVAGDVVAVLVDAERVEDSVVLGGVYTDRQTPPKSGDVIALQAKYVYVGDSMEGIQKASRDDRVQTELKKIKSELDSLVSAYNLHTHTIPDGSTAVPSSTHTQGYSVGGTAADSVYIK